MRKVHTDSKFITEYSSWWTEYSSWCRLQSGNKI